MLAEQNVAIVSSIGLLFGIVGVMGLLLFGITTGFAESIGGDNPSSPKKSDKLSINKIKWFSRISLGAIIVGFLIQIVSNHMYIVRY